MRKTHLYLMGEHGRVDMISALAPHLSSGLLNIFDFGVIYEAAALAGKLDCLKYLHDELDIHGRADLFDVLCLRSNLLDVIKYFTELGCACTESAMNFASETGNLELVKFLHFNRKEVKLGLGVTTGVALLHLCTYSTFLHHSGMHYKSNGFGCC